MKITASEFTLFYDGQCPLCLTEINALRKRDKSKRIKFENLHQPNFEADYPFINNQRALLHIHALYKGDIITGIDVNFYAWKLVGKSFWVKPLKWPITRPLAKLAYLLFARFRHRISAAYVFLTGKTCRCSTPPKG